MTPERNHSLKREEINNGQEINSLPEAMTNYTTDLTQLAAEGKLDPVIGRDDEIKRVIEILGRRTKNNPVLIGEAGVGKTAIAEGLAQLIEEGKVPTLKGKQIFRLDLNAMVAGATYRGEFEERIKKFLEEIKKRQDRVILFIDELHTIVGAGAAEGSMDAANILKPALARGELACIGATTADEYRKHIETDPALERRFQSVWVEEPSVETAVAILRGLKERYENFHQVKILDEALVAAVKLSSRYVHGRFLPDKAVDLIDEACSAVKIKGGSNPTEYDQILRQIAHLSIEPKSPEVDKELKQLRERAARLRQQQQETKGPETRLESLKRELAAVQKSNDVGKIARLKYILIPQAEKELSRIKSKIPAQVTVDDVAEVVQHWTGIPVVELLAEESAKLANMEKSLKERIIGQDEAIKAVAKAVLRQKTGLQDPSKPPSLMFLGPTGVGKTELARALAEFLFNDKEAIVRIDMSEYQEKHSVARLIGAPPGYVGYEEAGQLTEAIRRRPYSVVLLDETEKAHPEIFNAFLQVLDAGRLTDGQGRTVDFRNVIFIMTSNLNNEEEVRKNFRPEFFNRLDEIIVFHSLDATEMAKIVELRINELAERLTEQKLNIEITQEAKDYLARTGYDQRYGARPLARLVVKEITDIIALMKVEGKIKPGQKISVDFQNGQIALSVL